MCMLMWYFNLIKYLGILLKIIEDSTVFKFRPYVHLSFLKRRELSLWFSRSKQIPIRIRYCQVRSYKAIWNDLQC